MLNLRNQTLREVAFFLNRFSATFKNFDMKAPDKIYISKNENVHGRLFDDDIAYIRKDLLLEWAKEKKAELLDDEELTDVAAGINMGMDMLIYKLEQL